MRGFFRHRDSTSVPGVCEPCPDGYTTLHRAATDIDNCWPIPRDEEVFTPGEPIPSDEEVFTPGDPIPSDEEVFTPGEPIPRVEMFTPGEPIPRDEEVFTPGEALPGETPENTHVGPGSRGEPIFLCGGVYTR